MLVHWGTQAKTLVSPLPSNIQPAATIWCSYRYGGADGCCWRCLSRDSIARLVGHVDAFQPLRHLLQLRHDRADRDVFTL